MDNNRIISPLDGRYSEQLSQVRELFSEFKLMQNKVKVETLYFLSLNLNAIFSPTFTENEINTIYSIYKNFTQEDYDEIISIEKNDTHHDIKAIEKWIKKKLISLGFSHEVAEYVHFGLTSQDVVSVATNITLANVLTKLEERFDDAKEEILNLRKRSPNAIFLARTHGQYAIPTSLPREMMVYVSRIEDMISAYNDSQITVKIGGAIGNSIALYNVLTTSNNYSTANANQTIYEIYQFVLNHCSKKYFKRAEITTQTDNWRYLTVASSKWQNLASILIDFCRDIWMYFSYGYFTSEEDKGYCGSSTMPHKINPIKFENAEGCLEKVENDLSFLQKKLNKSRLQRDLSDSVVIRTIFETFAYYYLALDNIVAGLKKLSVNYDVMKAEIDNNYQVLSEAVQLFLREANHEDGYKKAKEMFQNLHSCTKQQYQRLINDLGLPEDLRYKLINLEPKDYYKEF